MMNSNVYETHLPHLVVTVPREVHDFYVIIQNNYCTGTVSISQHSFTLFCMLLRNTSRGSLFPEDFRCYNSIYMC